MHQKKKPLYLYVCWPLCLFVVIQDKVVLLHVKIRIVYLKSKQQN